MHNCHCSDISLDGREEARLVEAGVSGLFRLKPGVFLRHRRSASVGLSRLKISRLVCVEAGRIISRLLVYENSTFHSEVGLTEAAAQP